MARKLATAGRNRMSSRDLRRKRQLLLERDGDRCHWCQAQFTDELPLTVDHLIPVSRQGRDALWNLVLACKPCNQSREHEPPADVVTSRQRQEWMLKHVPGS